jgi:hypothetical protein
MKHIIKYRGILHESEELDQEIEDLKHLVDLGMVDSQELKDRRRQKYGASLRDEFLARLDQVFRELGITPFDYTTDRQRKNGTRLFQLAPAQVEKLLFEYPVLTDLPSAQGSRMRRLLSEIEPYRDILSSKSEIFFHEAYRFPQFQYYAYPRDIRGTSFRGGPNPSGFVKFDGDKSADELVARFIYQLALDTHAWTSQQTYNRNK